ncbi:hypothetical protein BGZ65_008464, partial [Modicella reniformis]
AEIWHYGTPAPMARYVLMGSYNRLVYNLPILFAWGLVLLTLLPFAITPQKRLMMEDLALEGRERQRDKRRHCSVKDTYYRHQDLSGMVVTGRGKFSPNGFSARRGFIFLFDEVS